ncbi:MAG: hypothetical protein WCR98_05765 [Saccharofermentanales bacterium]|jgi:hypothetical protein
MNELDNALEYAADDLLRKNKSLGVAHGIYRECDLRRRTAKEISLGADVEFVEAKLFAGADSAPKITVAELIEIANLTTRQRQACRLMMRLGKQKHVAQAMNITQPSVAKLLSRAFLRIMEIKDRAESEQPSNWAYRLFYEELAYKRRLTYRKATHPMSTKYSTRRRASKH